MLSRAEESLLRGLHRRKVREEEGLFVAEGLRVVEDLVASGLPLRFAVVAPTLESSDRGRALASALEARGPVRRVDERVLARFADTETPQGVLAVAEIPRRSLDDVVLADSACTVLALDGVQDPGNFGTMVRTAEALGAAAVVALPGTVDPWNPKAVRSSAGASFRIPIVQPDVDSFLAWAHAHRVTVYGADAEGEPVDSTALAPRAALVVGNEGSGMSQAMLRRVDRRIAIPITGKAESLNAAVAAAILLFLLTRKR